MVHSYVFYMYAYSRLSFFGLTNKEYKWEVIKKIWPLEKRFPCYIFSKGIKNYVFRNVSILIKVHSASFPWGKKMFLCMWTMQGIQISEDWHWNKHLVHKLRLHRALLNNMPFLKSEKFNSIYQSVPKQLLWFRDFCRL